MKIILFGSNGQIGREFKELAEKNNLNIISFNRQECDITDFTKVSKQIDSHYDAQYIINLVAYTAVDKAEQEKDQCYSVNFDGVKNIATAAKKFDIPLIHFSTDYVFDGISSEPYNESSSPNPISAYGDSKLKADLFLQEFYEKHIIIRVGWVFGKYGNNFVKTIQRLSQEKEALNIVHDQIGCPTSAKDIAKVVYKIINFLTIYDKPVWGTYNYSNQPPVSWYEFAKQIVLLESRKKTLKLNNLNPITTNEYPTLAKRPQFSILDTKKIEETFGVTPANWNSFLEELI